MCEQQSPGSMSMRRGDDSCLSRLHRRRKQAPVRRRPGRQTAFSSGTAETPRRRTRRSERRPGSRSMRGRLAHPEKCAQARSTTVPTQDMLPRTILSSEECSFEALPIRRHAGPPMVRPQEQSSRLPQEKPGCTSGDDGAGDARRYLRGDRPDRIRLEDTGGVHLVGSFRRALHSWAAFLLVRSALIRRLDRPLAIGYAALVVFYLAGVYAALTPAWGRIAAAIVGR